MENFENLKVFKVELGVYDYKYAIATGFDEAANKVIAAVKHERAVKEINKPVLDSDGSLINELEEKEIIIKGVQLVSDEIIF